MKEILETLPEGDREELLSLITSGTTILNRSRLYEYSEGMYVWQREFGNRSGEVGVSEMCLEAGNRVGKTYGVGMMCSMWLTGWYPEWWGGRRFGEPVEMWCGSVSGKASRDIVQRLLLGPSGEYGTGLIPGDLLDLGGIKMVHGMGDVVDYVKVKHIPSGEWSYLQFMTYEQGRTKWQGTSKDVVWFDEEPPLDIYLEGRQRLMDRDGLSVLSFTPLMGYTDLVKRLRLGGYGKVYKKVTWADAPHLSEDSKRKMRAGLTSAQKRMREFGEPSVGEDAAITANLESAKFGGFGREGLPGHYARICGHDFGMNHPAASVWCAWDSDSDVVYVYDCYRESDWVISQHVAAIKSRGDWIPVSWPHDGETRSRDTGEKYCDIYKTLGARMLPISARWDDKVGGGQSAEVGVLELNDRLNTGRLRVAEHLRQWYEEALMLHRKNGRLVALNDDLMKATIYALMMLRYARRPGSDVRRQTHGGGGRMSGLLGRYLGVR